MPIFGVISETFESEGESMSGDDDFFSVARTTPFVAFGVISTGLQGEAESPTFDTEGSDTLIDSIECIF